MEFNMDKIKSGLDKAAVFTVKKTGQAVSYAKLNLKKTELRGKIEDEYKKLGKLIYENAKNDGNPEDIEENFNSIIAILDSYNSELKECVENIDSYKED